MYRSLSVEANRALVRATLKMLESDAVLEETSSRDWASVTFTGARHKMALRIEGPDAGERADRFCNRLDAAEFELRGHVVADIVLAAREEIPEGIRLRIEALTVEDA